MLQRLTRCLHASWRPGSGGRLGRRGGFLSKYLMRRIATVVRLKGKESAVSDACANYIKIFVDFLKVSGRVADLRPPRGEEVFALANNCFIHCKTDV